MSLYERKVIPFQHDDDSDEDIPVSKKRKTVVKDIKPQPVVAKPVVDVLDLEEDDEALEDDDSSNRILKELEAKKKIKVAVTAAPVVLIADNDDEVVAKAQKLLQKVKSTKPSKSSAIDIVDLDDDAPLATSSSYVPPKIARANERRAKNAIDLDDDGFDYLRNLSQASSNFQSSSSSSSSGGGVHPPPAADDSTKLKLVTRLNGEHEWKWKVPISDTFDKMKKKFAEIYGVKMDQFKFIFDGSVLKDSETPEDVDMEDSNIIDVKMDKSIYSVAVASAAKYGKASDGKPPVSAPVHKSLFVDETPKVKLVTRLNGEHEWKWKVSTSEPFLKMKTKFAEIYGVKMDQFKFIFDGSVLKDSETPEDVDMEDSNIIDVKMDKSLYSKAVGNANKAKS